MDGRYRRRIVSTSETVKSFIAISLNKNMKLVIAVIAAIISTASFLTFAVSESSVSQEMHYAASTSPLLTETVDIPGLGQVIGSIDTTAWSNQTVLQFRGIPYALSPHGFLRFKAPVARAPWRHIFDATHYGRRCPEIESISKMSSTELKTDLEDCLNLCVYTKCLNCKRPVMFYIYGGGFYNGSASDHPPRYLMEKDIVLVVAQYRIGALGWLSTRTKQFPGNVPIMDLQMALQWVKDHITVFGGNPKDITVFGQSAGTAMIGGLLLSPEVPRSLIKKAIIQSGSILATWAINEFPVKQVQRVCYAVQCSNCKTISDWENCLTTVPVLQLLIATQVESFAPIVGDVNGIIPQHPAELIKRYHGSIPIMTGFTKHDGSFVLASYYDELKKSFKHMDAISVEKFANGMMTLINDTTHLSNNLMTRLLFTPKLLNSKDHKAALLPYFDLASIMFMKSPVVSFATHMFHKRLAPIYLYTFDYEGEHTRFGYEFGNSHYPFNGGIHHSNDNIYLFSTHYLNATDTLMAKKMVELWTSFAISGQPTLIEGHKISSMQTTSGPYFHINRDITTDCDILGEFTAAVDDPDGKNLDRENVPF